MANSADPDQLASSASQLIWIYTVCKGMVYPGSAGEGLMAKQNVLVLLYTQNKHMPRTGDLMHYVDALTFFRREWGSSIMTSCLLSCTASPVWKGVYS